MIARKPREARRITFMMTILAHRANLTGPHSVAENSLAACENALAEGFGLETDLRRDCSGAFYISHDSHPRSPANALEGYTELFRRYTAELAINVKELGYEAELVELMSSGRLGARSFYFDFELLEPRSPGAAQKRKIKSLPNHQDVRPGASRLSDHNEPMSQCLASSPPKSSGAMSSTSCGWGSRRSAKCMRPAGFCT